MQRLRTPCNRLIACRVPRLAAPIGSSFSASFSTQAAASKKTPSAAGQPYRRVKYEGHYSLSPLQRVGLTVMSAVSTLADPEKADMVSALGETTGRVALRQLHRSMQQHAEGREILRERPVMNEDTVDLAALAQLPEGTFGRAYADFMARHSFTLDSRCAVRFVDDPDLAYVITRYRQVHDLWHVLSGLPPSLEAEVALKWFEMVQTGLPVTALSALVGPVRVPRAGRAVLRQVYVPWAVRAGRKAKPLLSFWYERHWERLLEDVRTELNFAAAPPAE
jgi:ubiquinone biosynthesis protein COQ4